MTQAVSIAIGVVDNEAIIQTTREQKRIPGQCFVSALYKRMEDPDRVREKCLEISRTTCSMSLSIFVHLLCNTQGHKEVLYFVR